MFLVSRVKMRNYFWKTLTMSMVEQFFSLNMQTVLVSGAWISGKRKKYREIQGTYPVISLTFSSIKERNFEEARKKICATIQMLYQKCQFLLEGDTPERAGKKGKVTK